VHLHIGCRLALRCPESTPFLALVHPHPTVLEDLVGGEVTRLEPDRAYELLTESNGNRWSRWVAPAGDSGFDFAATVVRPDQTDPVVPSASLCPVRLLPIDTYRYLNASTYCDTSALMNLAWATFDTCKTGWSLVQDICDWVHERIRFDYQAVRAEKTASHTLSDGAGVCRDFAHLAIALCRCLNIPARYCTGYLGYTGIPRGEFPVDFSAWFEVFLGDRWYVFDARHNIPRCGRVLIARGRDAGDVPFLRSFGPHQLLSLEVITDRLPSPPCAEAADSKAAMLH
jgi:transglutaminase-like putative cysteine protease